MKGNSGMMKSVFSAAALSFMVVSAAWAMPVVSGTQGAAVAPSDIVKIKDGHHGKGHGGKNWNRHGNWKGHGGGRYHYGGRYWGHRYSHRPYNWHTLGCVAVGPVWYCP